MYNFPQYFIAYFKIHMSVLFQESNCSQTIASGSIISEGQLATCAILSPAPDTISTMKK